MILFSSGGYAQDDTTNNYIIIDNTIGPEEERVLAPEEPEIKEPVIIETGRKDEFETFHKGPMSHGFSIGISTEYGQLNEKDALLIGGSVTYIMNHAIEIGFAGKGFFSERSSRLIETGDEVSLTGGYGGLYFVPHFYATNKIHFNIPVMIAAGGVGYYEDDLSDLIEGESEVEDWEAVFIVEPGFNLVFNLTRNFQMEIGGAYRFSSNTTLDHIGSVDMDGFSAGLRLKFGIF
jgi:hypothetical protein